MAQVEFGGFTHDFPDDFTPQDIATALSHVTELGQKKTAFGMVNPNQTGTPIHPGLEGAPIMPGMSSRPNPAVASDRPADTDMPSLARAAAGQPNQPVPPKWDWRDTALDALPLAGGLLGMVPGAAGGPVGASLLAGAGAGASGRALPCLCS